MNCKRCNTPVILVPSAEERAKKYGGRAEDYTRLFQYHNECQLALRREQTRILMQKGRVTA